MGSSAWVLQMMISGGRVLFRNVSLIYICVILHLYRCKYILFFFLPSNMLCEIHRSLALCGIKVLCEMDLSEKVSKG